MSDDAWPPLDARWERGPLDAAVYAATAPLLPLLHATGHTPNAVTTYSLACGLLAALALWRGHPGAFVALYLLGYVWDCVDGALARRYRQSSRFGDWYDHVSDWLVLLAVAGVVLVRRGRRLGRRDALVVGAVAACAAVSVGCEQRHRRARLGQRVDGSAALDWFVPCCPACIPGAIRVTRHVGLSPAALALVAYVWWIWRRRPRG